jgi:hypothetical protein
MAPRRSLEEIVPSREGVGQETTTARVGLGTDRGRVGTPALGPRATAVSKWCQARR